MLLAPVYLEYGKALVKVAVSKGDALGGGGGGGGAEGNEEEDAEEDEVVADGAAGVSESKVAPPEEGAASAAAAAAAPADEDLEKEDDDKEDDLAIAFECLDTARVIYSRCKEQSKVRAAGGRWCSPLRGWWCL